MHHSEERQDQKFKNNVFNLVIKTISIVREVTGTKHN